MREAIDTTEIVRLRESGLQWRQVADRVGISESTARTHYRNYKQQAPPPPAAVEAMQGASFESRLKRLERENSELRAKLEPRRLPVEQEHEAEIQDVGEYWQRCEEKATADIARANTKGQFKVTLDDSDVIGLSFISDQHIGPGTPVDFKRMRLDAELIAATPGMYAMLGGDLCDNHIKHRPAIMAARSQPSDQWRLGEYYLSIFAEKIAVVVSGNHDDWTDEIAGISVLEMVCRAQRVCFAPDEAFLDLSLGTVKYRIGMRHQFGMNSRFNQTHAVKQWQRLGDYEFDIGCVGHHHEACYEMALYRQQPCVYIRPGSYQITSSYSRRFGYNRSIPTCPTVLLWPHERRMMGFWDVRDAAEMLTKTRAA